MKATAKKIALVFVLYLLQHCICVPLQAQPNKDSLVSILAIAKDDSSKVNLLLRLSKIAYITSTDTGVLYGQKAYQLSLTKGSAKQTYKVCSWLNECYLQKGINDKALEFALLSIKYAEATKDDSIIVEANVNTAKLYAGTFSNLNKGLEFGNRAYTVAQATKDLGLIVDAQECMSTVYEDFDAKKALAYDQAAYKTALELKNDEITSSMLSALANCYLKNDRHAEAIDCYKKAIDLAEIKKKPFDMAALNHNIGNVYKSLKDYKTALAYYLKTLEIVNQYRLKDIAGMTYTSLADTYIGLRDYKKALYYNNLGVEVEKKRGSLQRLSLHYITNSKIYDSIGDCKNAYRYYRLFIETYPDAVNMNDSRNKIVALETQRTTELKQKEIQLINKDRQLQRFIRNALIAGFAMLTVLIIVLVRSARLKRTVALERIRSRLSRDLHDDIGSTLSSINILSRTAQNSIVTGSEEKARVSLEKINERSQRLLDSMSDIIWNIKPGKDTIEEVMSRMREYATTILEAKSINYTFNFPKEKLDCKLTMEVKNNIYLIFKEAVNNLSKYADCTQAVLSLTFDEKHIHLTVEDNGLGFDAATIIHNGGLRNMQQRADEINGSLEVLTGTGKGVTIKFTLPL